MASAQSCISADSPVRCSVCTEDPFRDVNVMSSLPRVTRTFQATSSNIAQYQIFDCPDATNPDTPCTLASDLQNFDVAQLQSPPENSVVNYGDGVLMYSAFAIVCTVLLPLLALCFCICRCHLTCCLCGMDGGCCLCGRGIPERKAPDSCCSCGFIEVLDPLSTSPPSVQTAADGTGPASATSSASAAAHSGPKAGAKSPAPATAASVSGARFHYSRCDRWSVRACLAVYLLLVVIFAVLGHQLGSVRLTDGMVLMSKAADSFVPVARGLYSSAESYAIDLTADVVVPAIGRINDTVHLQSSPRRIIRNTICVIDKVGETADGIRSIRGSISSLLTSLDNISAVVGTVDSSVVAVNGSLEQIIAVGDTSLKADLQALGSATDRTESVANQVASAIDGVETSLAKFKNTTSGLPAVQQRLTWYNNRPTSAQASASATDAQQLAAGSLAREPKSSDRVAAIDRFTTLRDSAVNLTGVSNLPSLLRSLNSDVDEFRGHDKAGAVLRAINATRDLVASLPNITHMILIANSTSDAIAATTSNLAPVRASIIKLRTVVNGLSLSFIDTAAAQLDAADAIVACLSNMQPDLQGINETVVQLPAIFSSIQSQITSVNDSLASARSVIDDASAQADGLQAQIDELNFTKYLDDIDSLQGANASSFGSLSSQTGGVSGAIDGLNLDSVYDSVLEVNRTVSRPGLTVNETTLARLEAVTPLLGNVSHYSNVALSAATYYHAKRCWSTGALCTTSATCGGGACESGIAKCVPTANPDAGVAGSANCSAAVPCSVSGQECSLRYDDLSQSAAALNLYAAADMPDMSAASSAVTSLRASVDSVSGLSSARSSVADLNSTLGGITFNATASSEQIDAALSSAKTARPTLKSVRTTIAGVQQQLGVRSELSNASSLIDSASDAVESADGVVSPLRGAKAALLSFESYWYGALPGLLENKLSRSALEARAASKGLAGVALAVSEVLIDLVDQAGEIAGAFSASSSAASGNSSSSNSSSSSGSAFSLPVNMTELILRYSPTMEALSNPDSDKLGGIHFAMSTAALLSNATGMDLGLPAAVLPDSNPAAAQAGAGIFTDAVGNAWSDGAVCVTRNCIDGTINALNKEPLGDAITSISVGVNSVSSGGQSQSESISVPLPVSRELLFSAPLAIPILIALLGFLPVICCCRCSCQPCCTRCLACCHQFSACCCMAILFLIFGGLLFPIVMVTSDVCASGLNVGYTYVDRSEASICSLVSGDLLQPGRCVVSIDTGTSAGNADLTINLPRLYSSMLGEDGCTPAGRTEVVNAFTAVGALSDRFFETSVNTTVVDVAASAGVPIREPLRIALLLSARSAGSATDSFLSSLGSSALSCDNVNSMVGSFTDGVCCGFVGPVYWVVSSWYLIAFAMCILGWGGSVFAYKRLPNELWGAYYNEALEMPLDARRARMQQRELEKQQRLTPIEPHRSKVAPDALNSASLNAVDGESFEVRSPVRRAGKPKADRAAHVAVAQAKPRGS
ncbi:hypothetical protein FNF28_03710 [Cafeteria roenbergensis]|uniref:Uncharacterized protein n=1 Tax=Cafeteria roenbergensis TaxID=33653 RepID=A0A5A8DHT9_CAFRO|nr:hypothetical protein FNF28_03710 [Cafeteria roenbergensis]